MERTLKSLTTTYTMTLLDKTFYLLRSGLALLLVPIFFACDDPTDLGLRLELQESNLKTNKIELPLSVSTVYIDSLRTNVGNKIILGQFEDEISGKIIATPYMSYAALSGIFPGDSLIYHSANISLKHTQVRTLPTVMQLDVEVHEVNADLYANPIYLSNRKLEINENTLGSLSETYAPSRDSAFSIPLNDDFGRMLYTRLRNASDTGYIQGFDGFNLDSVRLVYRDSTVSNLYPDKPLALVPSTTSSGLLKFDLSTDSVTLNVVMMDLSGRNFYEYNYTFNSNYYTHIERDKSSSIHSDLQEEYQPSSNPGNIAYLDMVGGFFPKVDLKNLYDFTDSLDNFLINKASFSFPIEPSVEGFIDNSSFLTPYVVRDNGKLNIPDLLGGNYLNNVVLANSNNVYYSSQTSLQMPLDSNVSYNGDITLFTDYSLNLFKTEDNKLAEELILISSDYLDLGRTALKSDEVTLTLYYTTTKE